ncbi:aquaporin-like isoform X2 [Planococcus citri]|uniref:aquaporin-like isoform X2 n=1 Tax=Planococcus citri TaxID=170843 RepID=UPI0031F907F4
MTKEKTEDFIKTAFTLEDFQGLGRRKIWRLVNLFLSEFFATAVTVYLGCAIIQSGLFGKPQNHLTIAIGFSFAVGTSITLFGHISGSHINPCLSLTSVILGKMSFYVALLYSVAQCLGSLFGYALTRGILTPEASQIASQTITSYNFTFYCDRCVNAYNPQFTVWQTVFAEVWGTGILIWAVCSAWDSRNKHLHDSMPVKFAVVMVAIVIPTGLYSSCSLNPARSFGPALYNGLWEYHWIYWVGPILGTLITAVPYRLIFKPSHMEVIPESKRDPATLSLRNNKDDDA